MALNIKDPVTERLAAEVARLAGESKTGAIRRALLERKERLETRIVRRDRLADLERLLAREIWPHLPPRAGRRRLTRAEREKILGFGPEGV